MTCSFCSVYARHPCDSKEEASRCNNNSNPGLCMDFRAKDVATWIRARSYGDEKLEAAADLIEKEM